MAFFGVIPFGPEQLERMTGVQDRKGFYLEDDVEQGEDFIFEDDAGQGRASSDYIIEGQIRDEQRKAQPPIGAYPSQQYGPGIEAEVKPKWMTDYYTGWKDNVQKWGEENIPMGFREFQQENPTLNEAIGAGAKAVGGALTEPRTKSGIGGMIAQADELVREVKPTSLAEAQAAGQKTFWVGDKEKLAVTREQLADFKASDAYDPTSGKSALSQWSSAWQSPDVVSDVPQALTRGVREILIEEEGMKLTPYDDPGGGKRTVGVGHQLGAGEEARDVSETEARETLETDISGAYDAVDRLAEKFDVGEIPSELRDELMMMAFQMGATGLSKFKKMWAAMKNQDWGEMVAQMADSRWAKSQTPERAARTIDRVATLMGV